jgi:G3E family GTPase
MSASAPFKPARCNLITGFLGAGKTTVIRHLLAQRTAAERWAVIVNEFGAVGIDGATLAAGSVEVREVAGGCICCAANVPLRVAITDVLRRVRPDRLLIEPSGLGHPAAILATLAEPGLAGALSPAPVLCVVDPRQLDSLDRDWSSAHADTWRDQLTVADVVIASKRDLATDAQYARLEAYVDGLYPPKQALVSAVDGQVARGLLDVDGAHWRPALLRTGLAPNFPRARAPLAPWAGDAQGCASGVLPAPEGTLIPGLGTRFSSEGLGVRSIGWLFDDPAAAVFDSDRLDRLLIGLPAALQAEGPRLLRAKGAFRTDHGSRLIEWSGAQLRSQPLAFRGPGRFELLVDDHTRPDAARIEAGLLSARPNQN